jgi:hypothetical protein
MAATRKRASAKPRKLKVGDRVWFQYVTERLRGVIIEDRGPIGAGGRQLVTIRAMLDRTTGHEIVFEMPAEELHRA